MLLCSPASGVQRHSLLCKSGRLFLGVCCQENLIRNPLLDILYFVYYIFEPPVRNALYKGWQSMLRSGAIRQKLELKPDAVGLTDEQLPSLQGAVGTAADKEQQQPEKDKNLDSEVKKEVQEATETPRTPELPELPEFDAEADLGDHGNGNGVNAAQAPEAPVAPPETENVEMEAPKAAPERLAWARKGLLAFKLVQAQAC